MTLRTIGICKDKEMSPRRNEAFQTENLDFRKVRDEDYLRYFCPRKENGLFLVLL